MARHLFPVAALAALLLLPAPAVAGWTASVSGESAILVSDAAPDAVEVTEAGGLLVHGLGGEPGFESDDDWDTAAAGVQTALAGSQVEIAGGDGDDRILVAASAPAVLAGGAGDDTLSGSPLADELDGGDGSDRLLPGRGADTVAGGAGADVLRWESGDGDDTFAGGEGADRLEVEGGDADDVIAIRATASGLRVERTTAALFAIDAGSVEEAVLRGHGGADTLVADAAPLLDLLLDGGPGADRLTGGPGDDVIDGGGGADALDGGAGTDLLLGGDGDDELAMRDGVAESGRCGDGADRAVADAVGIDVLGGCEEIDQPPAEQPPVQAPPLADTQGLAPRLSLARRIRRGRVRVRVRCPSAETGGCQGRLTLATGGKVRVGGIRAVVVLGESGFSLAAGASTRLVLELPRGWRGLLRRKRLTVRATAASSDAFDNRSEASARARLRR